MTIRLQTIRSIADSKAPRHCAWVMSANASAVSEPAFNPLAEILSFSWPHYKVLAPTMGKAGWDEGRRRRPKPETVLLTDGGIPGVE